MTARCDEKILKELLYALAKIEEVSWQLEAPKGSAGYLSKEAAGRAMRNRLEEARFCCAEMGWRV